MRGRRPQIEKRALVKEHDGVGFRKLVTYKRDKVRSPWIRAFSVTSISRLRSNRNFSGFLPPSFFWVAAGLVAFVAAASASAVADTVAAAVGAVGEGLPVSRSRSLYRPPSMMVGCADVFVTGSVFLIQRAPALVAASSSLMRVENLLEYSHFRLFRCLSSRSLRWWHHPAALRFGCWNVLRLIARCLVVPRRLVTTAAPVALAAPRHRCEAAALSYRRSMTFCSTAMIFGSFYEYDDTRITQLNIYVHTCGGLICFIL